MIYSKHGNTLSMTKDLYMFHSNYLGSWPLSFCIPTMLAFKFLCYKNKRTLIKNEQRKVVTTCMCKEQQLILSCFKIYISDTSDVFIGQKTLLSQFNNESVVYCLLIIQTAHSFPDKVRTHAIIYTFFWKLSHEYSNLKKILVVLGN